MPPDCSFGCSRFAMSWSVDYLAMAQQIGRLRFRQHVANNTTGSSGQSAHGLGPETAGRLGMSERDGDSWLARAGVSGCTLCSPGSYANSSGGQEWVCGGCFHCQSAYSVAMQTTDHHRSAWGRCGVLTQPEERSVLRDGGSDLLFGGMPVHTFSAIVPCNGVSKAAPWA